MPLRFRKSLAPQFIPRIECTASLQRTCTHKTAKQISYSTAHRPAACNRLTILAGGKRSRDGSYPGALCGQRAEGLPSPVARSLLLRCPERSGLSFYFWYFPQRSALLDLPHSTPCLSREYSHCEGWKLNLVEDQPCCDTVLTARLRHIEGGQTPALKHSEGVVVSMIVQGRQASPLQ